MHSPESLLELLETLASNLTSVPTFTLGDSAGVSHKRADQNCTVAQQTDRTRLDGTETTQTDVIDVREGGGGDGSGT